MVKIDVIFMSFSNPMCRFRNTADFAHLKTYHGKVSCISEMQVPIFLILKALLALQGGSKL